MLDPWEVYVYPRRIIAEQSQITRLRLVFGAAGCIKGRTLHDRNLHSYVVGSTLLVDLISLAGYPTISPPVLFVWISSGGMLYVLQLDTKNLWARLAN